MRVWVARGLRLVCVLIATTVAVTCVQTSTDRCEDGTVCPDGTQCRLVTGEQPLMTCVTDAQLTACSDVADGSACMLDRDRGTCLGDACYPATCGDHIRDLTEACDDGNRAKDDGCSENCLSLERCGDGLVDLLRLEQCDDGTTGLSGDGCSSACLTELDLWQQLIAGTPGRRIGMAAATDPIGGVMLFGGTPGAGSGSSIVPPVDDTWRWKLTSWRAMTPPQQHPPARSNAAAALDPLRKRVVMFGGTSLVNLGDLWEWDGYAWTERTAPTSPSARERASMACAPSRCVLVGGRAGTMALGDAWIWNGATWTEMTGTLPEARFGAAIVYDSTRDVFVLFGGQGPGGVLGDTWEFGTTWTARVVAGPPVSPSPHAAYDPVLQKLVLAITGQTWTYDGTTWQNMNQSSLATGELVFDPASGRVTSLTTQNQVLTWDGSAWSLSAVREPSFASTSLAAFEPAKGRTIVHDGFGTYSWDGVSWSVLSVLPATQPPTTTSSAMAFDRACNQAVMVGGGNGSAARRDTWTFDDTWRLYADTLLVPRGRHAMTYDSDRDALVLFGGLGANSAALGDTWEWTGPCNARTWTERVAASGPSARAGAKMAYDPKRRVAVMFGGEINGAVTDETWEWNGAQWQAMTSVVKPPARSGHALAYDPRRHAVILVGGTNGAVLFSDTWRWDGVTWTPIGTLVSPPGNADMALAEELTGNLIMLGGRATGLAPVLWRLQSSTAFEPVESCRLATTDSDGDALLGCADPDCGTRCRPMCPLGQSCAGPHCGDGTCSVVEDYLICPGDCPAP